MRTLALILCLAFTLNAQILPLINKPAAAAAPGGCTEEITEDFSTDPSGRWSVFAGGYYWDSDYEYINLNTGTDLLLNDTQLSSDDGWAIVQMVSSVEYAGIAFRHNGASPSLGYVLRHNSGNTYRWRYCSNASCTDIESTNLSYNDGDYMHIYWYGTGSNTRVEVWISATKKTGCPSSWGTPDHTYSTDPGANARDSGKYVGVYDGGTGDGDFYDNFSAGTE